MYTFIRNRLKLLFKKNPKLLCNETKRKETLNLGNLPFLILSEVVRSMSHAEIIKLALCSKKMENRIKSIRKGLHEFGIHINDDFPSIHFGPNLHINFPDKNLEENEEQITRKEVSRWHGTNKKDTQLEKMFNVYKHLISLFPCQELRLGLYLDSLSKASIKKFFAYPEIQNWKLLMISKGNIKSKELTIIMDMANSTRQIFIDDNTEFPGDFRHEKAFAFKSMDYKNAMWVQIEDLYSLKNSHDVILGRNNFANSDINMLIQHWLSSDCDMFEYLKMDMKENVTISPDLVLEDVIYLKSTRFGGPVYFFNSKSTENRSSIIAYVYWRDSKFYMTTWTLEDVGKDSRTFRKEYEILEMLNRFEKFKEELKSIVEGKQVGNDMELQEVTAKKIKMNAEIEELERQLTEYGVYFENGKAKIDK